jgi:ATP-dependent Clp protease adaptor protein ClpS
MTTQDSTMVRTTTQRRAAENPDLLPPFNVILIDDNDHTYDYVIELCSKVFAHPKEKGFQFAKEVDTEGRVILLTTTKEHAELKRDQIHSIGPDWRLDRSKGSMTAMIEPADE